MPVAWSRVALSAWISVLLKCRLTLCVLSVYIHLCTFVSRNAASFVQRSDSRHSQYQTMIRIKHRLHQTRSLSFAALASWLEKIATSCPRLKCCLSCLQIPVNDWHGCKEDMDEDRRKHRLDLLMNLWPYTCIMSNPIDCTRGGDTSHAARSLICVGSDTKIVWSCHYWHHACSIRSRTSLHIWCV